MFTFALSYLWWSSSSFVRHLGPNLDSVCDGLLACVDVRDLNYNHVLERVRAHLCIDVFLPDCDYELMRVFNAVDARGCGVLPLLVEKEVDEPVPKFILMCVVDRASVQSRL